jgi:hypothetical protein
MFLAGRTKRTPLPAVAVRLDSVTVDRHRRQYGGPRSRHERRFSFTFSTSTWGAQQFSWVFGHAAGRIGTCQTCSAYFVRVPQQERVLRCPLHHTSTRPSARPWATGLSQAFAILWKRFRKRLAQQVRRRRLSSTERLTLQRAALADIRRGMTPEAWWERWDQKTGHLPGRSNRVREELDAR